MKDLVEMLRARLATNGVHNGNCSQVEGFTFTDPDSYLVTASIALEVSYAISNSYGMFSP